MSGPDLQKILATSLKQPEPAVRGVEVGTLPPDAKEGLPRRNWLAKDGLFLRPAPDVGTLYDLLAISAKKYAARKCVGRRDLLRLVKEEKEISKISGGKETKEKKTWTYFELSPYKWETYTQMLQQVNNIGCGLNSLGYKKGDILCIYAATSVDWVQVTHGAYTRSITIATAYDTLGEEGLEFSLNETESPVMFTTTDLFPMLKKVLSKCPHIKTVIYGWSSLSEKPKDGQKHPANDLQEAFPKIEVISLDDLKKKGAEEPVDHVKPEPSDTACIMYTSGTTGNPKGVIIPHSMVVAAVASGTYLVSRYTGHVDDPTYLAYLPLAHIIAFSAFHAVLWLGFASGFGSPRSLTDLSVRNCKGDIAECRPHIMTGVPAVFDTIRRGILNRIHGSSGAVQSVFNTAYAGKWWSMQNGLPTGLWDFLVFNKIRENLGGRVVWGLCGGAPLSRDTQKFFSIVGAPLVQGWGLTETCGSGCLAMPSQITNLGVVGEPTGCSEIKLVDVEDMGYSSKNKPNPQGEILIRGPNVTPGYFKQPKVTAESFTPDGWFMTGDIGEWQPDGTLKIIDRKKNLIKLARGEYIALEKLESLYKLSLYVVNICVCADPLLPQPVALICPSEPNLRAASTRLGAFPNDSHPSMEDLCANPAIVQEVLKSLRTVAKEQNLAAHEILDGVALVQPEWTAQNGLLTAANKLKRREISRLYETELAGLFKNMAA